MMRWLLQVSSFGEWTWGHVSELNLNSRQTELANNHLAVVVAMAFVAMGQLTVVPGAHRIVMH